MSKPIIAKRCCHCKKLIPLRDFGKNRSRKDGLQDNCKPCRRIFDVAYQKSDKGKRCTKKHTQTEKFITTQNKYKQSPKGRLQQARFRANNKKSLKARERVNVAVRGGRLPRPDSLQCSNCEEQAHNYHHYIDYTPEHWLDVIAVCIKCHWLIHNIKSKD